MSGIDPRSSTWLNLKDHIQKRQATLLLSLASPDCDWEQTQMKRARLQELAAILALAQHAPAPLVEQDFELPG